MPTTLQNSKIGAPRTHSLPILMRHNPRNLVQMRQVMRRPCRQQLRQSHHAESRMPSQPLQILSPQIQSLQFTQVLRPQTSKFIQQQLQRFAVPLLHMPRTIERLKRPALPRFQYHPRSRHPIHPFPGDQMPHHIEHAPRALALIAHRPHLRQPTHQRIQCSGSATKQRHRLLQIMSHHSPTHSSTNR
ncbi:MAG: hypothetical protein JWQ49_3144 [Edaphobacter sp.]|nr:hypothetical protein [Edaphobacter sp.]